VDDEVLKHVVNVPDFKCIVNDSSCSLDPFVLAAADLVITTYEVLRKDFHHRNILSKQLRHELRFISCKTPLLGVAWKRVILDEAQMVESSTAMASEMACDLVSKYRWCVTGTPVLQGLSDKEDEVIGSWSSRISGIVGRLLRIRRNFPASKTIVFSQWNDVLDLVQECTTLNGIQSLRLRSDRSVIKTFREDPAWSCMFLLLKSGANGLNLSEATHVILHEPTLSPGVHAQAIARVQRIGQTQQSQIDMHCGRNAF